MSIEIDYDEWKEFLTDYGNGCTRRCPDGTAVPY